MSSRRRNRSRAIRGVATAALTLAGILGAAGIASASAPSDYLSTGQYTAVFLQFTISSGRIVGLAYVDTVEGSNPNAHLSTESVKFTGTDSGDNLTLYFADRASAPTFGTLNGRSLSLQLQQNNGTITTLTLGRSTVSAYNNFVSRWQTVIRNANARVSAQQAAAAARAAHQKQLLNNLNTSIDQVDSDLSNMQSPGNLSDDLPQVSDDLAQVSDDLAQVGDDNTQVGDDLAAGENPCNDISAEYGDSHVTYTDAETMLSYAKYYVGGDIGQERQFMGAAPDDWANYWQAQDALPTYKPTNPIPPLKVALAAAQKIINGAVAQVNSDIDQANGYVAQAYRMANAAQVANHCGPATLAPKLGHVTAASL